MQINEKLPFIDELIVYAEELENNIPGKGAEDSSDQDFYVYNLLHRTVRFAKAVVELAEKDFFHEIVLLGRVELEGLACFMAYAAGILDVGKGDDALASKWRAAMRYENYLQVLKQNEQVAATKLKAYENTLDAPSFERLNKLVDGGPVQFSKNKWHGHRYTHNLFSLSKDKNAEALYKVVYNHFSEVVHWSPSGVLYERLPNYKEAAINSTFHCLCDITKYVNVMYPSKGFDNKLKDIRSRYVGEISRESASFSVEHLL
jgi:hypothetical protein